MTLSRLILLSIFITGLSKAQVQEDLSVIIDKYEHSSSNYVTNDPPIDINMLSNGDLIIVDQNDNFKRLTKEGETVWSKKFTNIRTSKKVILDYDENILVSFYDDLIKYDSDGELIWQINVDSIFNVKRTMINTISVSNSSNDVILVGQISYTDKLFILKLDKNGNVIWRKKLKQESCYNEITFSSKESILIDESLIFLTNSRDCAMIYKVSPKGKIIKTKSFDHNLIGVKQKDSLLIALRRDRYPGNSLIVYSINQDLEIVSSVSIDLPFNSKYKREVYSKDENGKVKVDYVYDDAANYIVWDFYIEEDDGIIISGSAANKMWLRSFNLDGSQNWQWDGEDQSMYVYDESDTLGRYQGISKLIKNDRFYYVSGISIEKDDFVEMFVLKINLFLKRITVHN